MAHLRSAILFSLLACSAAQVGWASVASCASGTTLNNYIPGDIQTGCAAVDVSFTNFIANTNGGNTGSASTFTLSSNSTVGDTLNSTNGLGVADFTSPDWQNITGANGGLSTIGYVVEAHTGDTIGGYTYTNGTNGYVTPARDPWSISTITADLTPPHTSSTGPAGDTLVSLLEEFCLGSTAGGDTSSCPSSQAGFIHIIGQGDGSGSVILLTDSCMAPGGVVVGTCNGNGFAQTADLGVTFTIPGAGVQAISIFDDLSFADPTSGSITINDLYNGFGQQSVAPEPRMFPAVVGVAGLVLLQKFFRRRRARCIG